MPRYLKLIARFTNSGLIIFMVLFSLIGIGKGDLIFAVIFLLLGALLGFNLYLIEKSAMLLSEEEWLKSEVRKIFLRRKLARLTREEATASDQRQ